MFPGCWLDIEFKSDSMTEPTYYLHNETALQTELIKDRHRIL